jgi:hypothetical protein
MHKLIGIIVYATNKRDALSKADAIASNLCDGSRMYDWYNIGEDIDRWDLPEEAMLADSKEGKDFINDQFKETEKEMKEAIKQLKDKLAGIDEKSVEKIIETGVDSDLYLSASNISDEDLITYLYNVYGEPIKTTKDLQSALKKFDDPEYKDLKVFVVPVDIHY